LTHSRYKLAIQTVLLSLVFLAILHTPAQGEELNAEHTLQLKPVTGTDVMQIVRSSGSGPVLVNIWATWCEPCCEEMPDLLRLRSEFKDIGFKLVLVSADFSRESQRAASFLGSLGVNFESYIKDQKDEEFINQIDPNWSGALPYSILFGADGKVIRTWDGRIPYQDVRQLLSILD
jgi:thiol-disulfide isomerase/thioredoxin